MVKLKGLNAKDVLFDDSSSVPPSTYASSVTGTSDGGEQSIRVRLGLAKTEREIDEILAEKIEKAVRLTSTDCLFCPAKLNTIDDTLVHMAKSHSFFVPDAEFLVDPEGLLQYLGDKISIANVCIFCNGKGRAMHSAEAVRAHMVL
jgi:pre-60S factor REI1